MEAILKYAKAYPARFIIFAIAIIVILTAIVGCNDKRSIYEPSQIVQQPVQATPQPVIIQQSDNGVSSALVGAAAGAVAMNAINNSNRYSPGPVRERVVVQKTIIQQSPQRAWRPDISQRAARAYRSTTVRTTTTFRSHRK